MKKMSHEKGRKFVLKSAQYLALFSKWSWDVLYQTNFFNGFYWQTLCTTSNLRAGHPFFHKI